MKMCEVNLREIRRLRGVVGEQEEEIENLKKEVAALKMSLEEKTEETKDSFPETDVVEIGGKMVNRIQSARRVADLIDVLNNYPGDAAIRIIADSGMKPISFVGAGFCDSDETRFRYVVVFR